MYERNIKYLFRLASINMYIRAINHLSFTFILSKEKLNTNSFICRINRFFRRIHKSLGIAVIFITLLHCRFSSQHFGLNTGTICF